MGKTSGDGDVLLSIASDSGGPHVSYAVGGALSTLSFEDGLPEEPTFRRARRGGGPRGRVRGFSRASRLRLQRRQAQIDRTAFRGFGGKTFFVTLTYGEVWPEGFAACKAHLKALRKRIVRRFGRFAAFWRWGVQRRGAWHVHLLIYAPPSFCKLKELRSFIACAWREVIGEVPDEHHSAGTCVGQLRTWKAMDRVGRYIAKEEEFPEGVTGRTWGVWSEELLPVRWETVRVGLEDAFRIRRVLRRLARRRGTGPLRRLTVFVRYQNVVRLLGFLGYPHEGP